MNKWQRTHLKIILHIRLQLVIWLLGYLTTLFQMRRYVASNVHVLCTCNSQFRLLPGQIEHHSQESRPRGCILLNWTPRHEDLLENGSE